MKKSLGARTVLYPLPVLLVGTYDDAGKPNIMTASWGGIVNSTPPMVAIGIRKERHTYTALDTTGEFTISFPSEENTHQADYCGLYSGKIADKCAELGLHDEKADIINAPIFEEFKACLLCKVKQKISLPTHDMFISEILDLRADENVLKDRKIDIERLAPILYDNISRAYYAVGKYLKPAYTEKRVENK